MRQYERVSTLLTSNHPEDWGKLLGDMAAFSTMLESLLHHGQVLRYGAHCWRTQTAAGS